MISYSLLSLQFPGPDQQESIQLPQGHTLEKGKRMKNSYIDYCHCTFCCGKLANAQFT